MGKNYEAEEEFEIDLWEIFYALRKKLWLILFALILGGGIATAYSKMVLTPMYTSTSMVYVLSKETTLTSLADLQVGSQLTKDYRILATSRPVLQEVIDELNLDMRYENLKNSLVLNNPADTRVLSISVEDADPARAKAIVDTVAKVSSVHIGDIMEMIPPKIIEEGIVSDRPSSPQTKKHAAIGGFVAAFLVCSLVILQVILNDTIRTEEDVERYLQLSILAAIPEQEEDRATNGKRRKKRPKKRSKAAKGGKKGEV